MPFVFVNKIVFVNGLKMLNLVDFERCALIDDLALGHLALLCRIYGQLLGLRMLRSPNDVKTKYSKTINNTLTTTQKLINNSLCNTKKYTIYKNKNAW